MIDGESRHLTDETMGALIEGTLPRAELLAATGHLATCAECRVVAAEGARFEAEQAEEKHAPRTWWLAVAAALVIALVMAMVIAVPLLRRRFEPATPLATLAAAAPHTHRNVEARLSVFPWARLQAPARGTRPADPEDLKLAGAAGTALESKDAHAMGVAYLLVDRRSESLETLERVAERSSDASVWNDLAAARLDTAVRDEHPAQLPLALADADHALRLDPKFAPALFNRALALEHLGLRDAARTAWQRYLDADPSSDWSAEARERLAKLNEHGEVFDEKALRIATGPRLQALVRAFPQEARTYAEGPFLAEWGATRSEPLLAQTRAIGIALRELHGESLLSDVVAAIDHSGEEGRARLAEAHRMYGEARRAYAARHVSAAEATFRQAASLFRACGSAMGDVAGYYAAQCLFDRQHDAAELKRLRAGVDPARHPALAAEVEWEMALAANLAGDPRGAIRHADAASQIFRRLGERMNAANADGLAAVALAVSGDSDRAWHRYTRALAGFDTDAAAKRRQALLQMAGATLGWSDERDAAAAILDVLLENSRNATPYVRAVAFAQRARTEPAADVESSLSRARATLAEIPDPPLRDAAKAEVDLADAVVRSCCAPQAFDATIAFMTKREMKGLLPDALLQRARAQRASGNDEAALTDCITALAEIDRSRTAENLSDISAADIATQVIEETIDIHLRRGDDAAAFTVADRSHSGVPLLPKKTALLEYIALPKELVVFSVVDGELKASRTVIERRQLTALVHTLASRIRTRAPEADVRSAAARLHALVIGPVESRLASVDDLVIVPDRHMSGVPFQALFDERRGRYLLEDFTVRIALTAAVERSPMQTGLESPLVVSDPPAATEARLSGSREEAQAIAALYGAAPLSGASATRDRFVASARESALIHYAGHATDGALLLASSDGDNGLLGSADVAHLALHHHPLVVLAACDTFRELSRAFLDAGARGVVGTLWEIDDDMSAPFFLSFHEQLRALAPPVRALREAQLAMLRSPDPRRKHPASWAVAELMTNSD
jgi:CHAT domain-containing protein